MPIFLLALSISPNLNVTRICLSFVIIHLFLYPASNGYNSYFDKDEGPIGGLKKPPPVQKGLYHVALGLDAVAVALGCLINSTFALMLLIYGLVSKAYSHPSIRLKKYPVLGWWITGLFQGFFTLYMCYVAINDFEIGNGLHTKVIVPAILSSIMLWASYPMSQIYQHEEDRKHGDITLSMKLGLRGTFVFAAIMFMVATAGFILYFAVLHKIKYAYAFLIAMAPVAVFFTIWLLNTFRDRHEANYRNTMRLNAISSLCLNGFFIYFFLDSSHILQAIRGG